MNFEFPMVKSHLIVRNKFERHIHILLHPLSVNPNPPIPSNSSASFRNPDFLKTFRKTSVYIFRTHPPYKFSSFIWPICSQSLWIHTRITDIWSQALLHRFKLPLPPIFSNQHLTILKQIHATAHDVLPLLYIIKFIQPHQQTHKCFEARPLGWNKSFA